MLTVLLSCADVQTHTLMLQPPQNLEVSYKDAQRSINCLCLQQEATLWQQ